MKKTTLKEISTHKAVKQGNEIRIYENGLPRTEDLKGLPEKYFEDTYLYSIPSENEDDLLAIFERYEENNRINVAEAIG